ncbi:DUF4352 domain-containing protein [Gracilibacillus alcaliphilus]|uniref:DUF4352 domain-containing protein n=1 Tax=Gracilibacillus alcaliphilus TaxID=1401441 RepID=UPI00195C945E|nr:DUF4352 domain-containing protein [Gracilibacillus alcaliphilus]MBM7676556.1 hypothetical protein [Gracilibacillus alcaliphilus]
MKKLLVLLFAGLLLVACSDDGDTTENTGEENTDTTTENEDTETDTDTSDDADQKKVYQIGETAVITSDLYEFDYEVTVNDFQLTKEVDGSTIDDYLSGALEEDVFAVVDITIKNISDESYVPNQMFSANFSGIDEDGGHTSYDEFFPEGDEELAPGEEVEGHLVYMTTTDYADAFLLKYEFTSDTETHFELPNPEQ